MDSIINRIINKLFRRSARAAVSHVVAKGKPVAHSAPLAKAQANTARETAKRARQAAKLTRRVGR